MSYNNKLEPVMLIQAWHSCPAYTRILLGVYPERRGFVKQNIHIKKGIYFACNGELFK